MKHRILCLAIGLLVMPLAAQVTYLTAPPPINGFGSYAGGSEYVGLASGGSSGVSYAGGNPPYPYTLYGYNSGSGKYYPMAVDANGNLIISGGITGSGTTGTIPIWTGTSALGNSPLTVAGGYINSTEAINVGTVVASPNGVPVFTGTYSSNQSVYEAVQNTNATGTTDFVWYDSTNGAFSLDCGLAGLGGSDPLGGGSNAYCASTGENYLIGTLGSSTQTQFWNGGDEQLLIALNLVEIYPDTTFVTQGSLIAEDGITSTAYASTTNCVVNSASPAASGAAPAGAFVVPTTTSTYTVDTSAVSADSRIFLQPISFAADLPSSPTCVKPLLTTPFTVSAVSAGTSFTMSLTATTGQTCFEYWIVN